MTGITPWRVDTGLFTEIFFTFVYIYTKPAKRGENSKCVCSNMTHLREKNPCWCCFVASFIWACPSALQPALTLCHLFYRVRISICTNLFSQTDSSCPKAQSKSVGRLEAELNFLFAGSEPWALTSRQDLLPSEPFCYACADWLLLLQLRSSSGTACFIATQQLNPQQTSKSWICHSLFYFFFFHLFSSVSQTNGGKETAMATGISSGRDKYLEAGCHVIQVITLT